MKNIRKDRKCWRAAKCQQNPPQTKYNKYNGFTHWHVIKLCLTSSHVSRISNPPTTKNKNIAPQTKISSLRVNSSLMETMSTKHGTFPHLNYISVHELYIMKAEFMQTALTSECSGNIKRVGCELELDPAECQSRQTARGRKLHPVSRCHKQDRYRKDNRYWSVLQIFHYQIRGNWNSTLPRNIKTRKAVTQCYATSQQWN